MGASDYNVAQGSDRGISFRTPVFSQDPVMRVSAVKETMHLGRDHQTLGCAKGNFYYDSNSRRAITTIGAWDWPHNYSNGNASAF